MKSIFVLNGPNLNLLGEREPQIYGAETLSQIEQRLQQQATAAGFDLTFRQTNHEGVLVDWIQEARHSACALILNAASFTHTSVAIHDALRALSLPIIEVHLSNIFRREPFRHHSYVSPIATGVICGFGAESYILALSAAIGLIPDSESASSTRSVHV